MKIRVLVFLSFCFASNVFAAAVSPEKVGVVVNTSRGEGLFCLATAERIFKKEEEDKKKNPKRENPLSPENFNKFVTYLNEHGAWDPS